MFLTRHEEEKENLGYILCRHIEITPLKIGRIGGCRAPAAEAASKRNEQMIEGVHEGECVGGFVCETSPCVKLQFENESRTIIVG